jgi:uncharacterized protein (DUF1499 family)
MRLLSHSARAALAASAVLLGACTGIPSRPDAPQTLARCGWLPNCVSSQAGRGGHAIAPIAADADRWQRLKAWIAAQPDWKVTADDGDFLQAVATTPTMGFRDDVQLLFVADTGLIHVYSASRLGISDLGANARRVERLRAEIGREN